MKPDKPGEWHSRDGRKIVVYDYHGYGYLVYRNLPDGEWNRLSDLKGDDWLPAVAPTFPELPPKPPQCYAFRSTGGRDYEPAWWQVNGDTAESYLVSCQISAAELTVVPHKQNDDAAIKRIEEAKRG